MSSRIYSVNPNSVITDQADAESNKRSLILSFVVGITLLIMGLPLLIIGSISTAEDRLAMLIPGAVMFSIGIFVVIVAAVKRATNSEQDIAQQRRGGGIDILEAVPGKSVRFRINNSPSNNDAWVGIYPVNAKDVEHGNRWGWLRDKHMDNASLPGQSEGRWSIRVFSDGGYTLHDRVDFDIVHSQVAASKYREEFISISEYDEVWNDKGSRAQQDVSVWRPRLPAGCYLLGMTAKNGHSPPTFPTLVIRASGSDIAPPERFDLVWWQERGQRRFWCWRPIPPPGYVSLGDVGTLSEHPPSPRDVVCVALECLSPNKQPLGEQIWNDRGGGAPKDGAFFAQPGRTGLFRCSDDNTHNRPRGEFYIPGGVHVPEETETLKNQRKYVFAPEEMAWNQHNSRAKAMGGHLATISSAEENEQVTRISGGKPVWVGGIRKGGGNGPGANHWYWSDGQPWSYTNWHPGEPNNAGGHENRVHLGLQARGTWNDVHEGWSGPAVYEISTETSPATTSIKTIEILEAVPGKPVRFKINNRPSSNDAWVGIYPSNASDHEHGEQGTRWHWIREIDVNNTSFPAQSEGNWSIRVFSDGGFTLHYREDFEIERIPFGEQLKIKQEIQEKKEEISEQIKEKMEEVEEKLPEEIKETKSFQEMKSTVENTVESLDEKANQAIEEVIVESTEQMEQVQEKVLLSLEDSLSKLNDTLERLDKAVMTKDRENIISELSGSQMNLNLTIDRIDNTIGYGIDEALRGGKTIVGNIEGIPHSVSIKVPESMNDFASGLEKGQTIEQKVTLSTFNSVRKMLEFVIDK